MGGRSRVGINSDRGAGNRNPAKLPGKDDFEKSAIINNQEITQNAQRLSSGNTRAAESEEPLATKPESHALKTALQAPTEKQTTNLKKAGPPQEKLERPVANISNKNSSPMEAAHAKPSDTKKYGGIRAAESEETAPQQNPPTTPPASTPTQASSQPATSTQAPARQKLTKLPELHEVTFKRDQKQSEEKKYNQQGILVHSKVRSVREMQKDAATNPHAKEFSSNVDQTAKDNGCHISVNGETVSAKEIGRAILSEMGVLDNRHPKPKDWNRIKGRMIKDLGFDPYDQQKIEEHLNNLQVEIVNFDNHENTQENKNDFAVNIDPNPAKGQPAKILINSKRIRPGMNLAHLIAHEMAHFAFTIRRHQDPDKISQHYETEEFAAEMIAQTIAPTRYVVAQHNHEAAVKKLMLMNPDKSQKEIISALLSCGTGHPNCNQKMMEEALGDNNERVGQGEIQRDVNGKVPVDEKGNAIRNLTKKDPYSAFMAKAIAKNGIQAVKRVLALHKTMTAKDFYSNVYDAVKEMGITVHEPKEEFRNPDGKHGIGCLDVRANVRQINRADIGMLHFDHLLNVAGNEMDFDQKRLGSAEQKKVADVISGMQEFYFPESAHYEQQAGLVARVRHQLASTSWGFSMEHSWANRIKNITKNAASSGDALRQLKVIEEQEKRKLDARINAVAATNPALAARLRKAAARVSLAKMAENRKMLANFMTVPTQLKNIEREKAGQQPLPMPDISDIKQDQDQIISNFQRMV